MEEGRSVKQRKGCFMGSYTSGSVPNTGVVDFRAYPADQAIGIIRAISIDRENRVYISGIDFNLTSQLPKNPDPDIQSEMRSVYSRYVEALTRQYGTGEARSSSDVDGVLWHLPSRASVDIGITHRSISVVIESPAMTDLTEAEEKYFAGGGEF